MSAVTLKRDGEIGLFLINNPPVNALGHEVRAGLMDCLAEALDDDQIKAIVIACEGRTFIAGADIREFGQTPKEPHLTDVIDALEGSAKPVVAAIHGTALGGGLEVALACHFRGAVASAKVGLPEVKLGLLPGAGGTQRLPRLAGVETALQMIVSGEPLPAPRAQEAGILDELVEGDDPAAGGVAFARKVVSENREIRRLSQLPPAVTDPAVFENFEKAIARKARGFLAPFHCIKAVRAAAELPFDEGIMRERDLFIELLFSSESAAQRHVFFAERQVARVPGLPKDTLQREINSAGIIGAGTMGGGIAMCFANAGIPVTIVETKQEALDRGIETIRGNYARTVDKGRLSREQMEARMGLITPSLQMEDLATVDIVIEAVFEDMTVKKEVFGRLDEICREGAILATNTSTLDVNEIAAATKRPQDVIGMHFFSPANVMKLLENVRGDRTADDVVATVMALSKKIGKVGVLVGVCDGFVGNRMLAPRGREAAFLVEEGALPQQVDKVLYDFGFPMGPFAMADLAGLDVGYRIRKAREATRDPDQRDSTWLDKIVEMDRLGQKTGAGVYRYEDGRTPVPDPEIEQLIIEHSKQIGIERRKISDEEILERCLYSMINEGAKILEEGIAARSLDIDIVWIYGYGFPVYRGGPMFYADQTGLGKVLDGIEKYRKQFGDDFWTPSPLLERLVKEDKGFGSL